MPGSWQCGHVFNIETTPLGSCMHVLIHNLEEELFAQLNVRIMRPAFSSGTPRRRHCLFLLYKDGSCC